MGYNHGYRSQQDEQPNQLRLLIMLHNIGATESTKALTIRQISEWTRMEDSELLIHLRKLIELGYVQSFRSEEAEKYHLTTDGIRKVLSLYS
jgi:DNA-binding MarR family transcriptional regulator